MAESCLNSPNFLYLIGESHVNFYPVRIRTRCHLLLSACDLSERFLPQRVQRLPPTLRRQQTPQVVPD